MAETLPSDLSKVDPTDAWKPWDGTGWNRKWVAHLYRRAAFGPTPAEADRALSEGFTRTLARIEHGEPDDAGLQELLAQTGSSYDTPEKIRAWWLYAILWSAHPLREKLTLFWHNHFATSIAKVGNAHLMIRQNLTIRKHALGRFRPFLLEMSQDPAMLLWLDSNNNLAGRPNENFAREVMELFSLGVGNYTEKDIQEAARAFTGWQADTRTNESEYAFQYKPEYHDNGPKTIFGKTGRWGGEDVIRLCCDKPACAKFLVGKLYNFLVSETPPPEALLVPLEEQFRRTDYDIGGLVRTMLGSRLFFSEHAYRKRVKWPIEYVIGAVRAVVPEVAPPADLLEPLSKMGQALFAPPNVKGWRTGTDWLNSATLLARNNFAEAVAMGHWKRGNVRSSSGGTFTSVGSAVKPTTATTASEPADAKLDPVRVLLATKPKTVPALVTRMSDLLYGQNISPATRAKIEKFLLEPGAAPKNPASSAPKPLPAPTDDSKPKDAPKDPPKEPPVAKKPKGGLDMNSPGFKQKAREALHALMCLPEYQLD